MRGGSTAGYRPGQDDNLIPGFAVLRNGVAHSSTHAHELTHCTGAKQHLDHDLAGRFGMPEPSVKDDRFPFDVCVVGGCGHVGLPLAITFASRELKVSVYDINDRAIALVRSGRMPFLEWVPNRGCVRSSGGRSRLRTTPAW